MDGKQMSEVMQEINWKIKNNSEEKVRNEKFVHRVGEGWLPGSTALVFEGTVNQ